MLAEDLKPPKMARNPLHNWVEQRNREREREREKESDRTSTPERELLKRKGTHTPGKPPN